MSLTDSTFCDVLFGLLFVSSSVVSIGMFALVRMKCGSGMMGLSRSYLKDSSIPGTRRRLVIKCPQCGHLVVKSLSFGRTSVNCFIHF